MKVLDLQCAVGHVFEGWFASETDFVSQTERSLVQCPICGDPSVVKKLSAPRLSLSGVRAPPSESKDAVLSVAQSRHQSSIPATDMLVALARRVLAETTDVGDQFAEEARKMHYGEKKAQGIRGTATPDEAHALADEGIEIMSLPLPVAHKGPLQ